MKRHLTPVTYPPGHFLELVYAHNFPPDFVPSHSTGRSATDLREAAVRARATSLAKGNTGTVFGLGSGRTTEGDVAKTVIKKAPK